MTSKSKTSGVFYKSLTETAELIKGREISPVELTSLMLDRISSLDQKLHSYITVAADLALEQARTAEREIVGGRYRGPLQGIPVAVKDIFYTRNVPTTCGSKILKDFVPDFDATAISRLYNAGAVLLGKLSLTEFAGIGYHSIYRPAVNPWNAEHWTGSSSSGSGVATAAGLCYAALGTDTGGSIRFPSAACGLVGVKPTYGVVSRYGVYPLADTLDHAGPMARRAEDAAILFDAIAGYDENDPFSRREEAANTLGELKSGVRGLKVGFDETFCSQDSEPVVATAIRKTTQTLTAVGAHIREIDLSALNDAPAVWGTIFSAECGAVHSEMYRTNWADYSAPFRGFLEHAQNVAGIDYVQASIKRQRIRRFIEQQLEQVDVMLCPSMALTPMALDGKEPHEAVTPEIGNKLLKFTSPFSLSGHPAVSVPCGFTADGLPLSMQLIGNYGREDILLRFAYAYEEATEWHLCHPDFE